MRCRFRGLAKKTSQNCCLAGFGSGKARLNRREENAELFLRKS